MKKGIQFVGGIIGGIAVTVGYVTFPLVLLFRQYCKLHQYCEEKRIKLPNFITYK